MATIYLLEKKDLENIKKIIAGYCWGEYNCYVKIYYKSFWKFPKTFKFVDYDRANNFYKEILDLLIKLI
jgi:hypothetical protein